MKKHVLENQTLTLFLMGELNSFNADDEEKKIESIIEGKELSSIIIDMGELTYISSAGLRIIARIRQRYDDVTLINVPESIFHILDMVGFQNLMRIQKRDE